MWRYIWLGAWRADLASIAFKKAGRSQSQIDRLRSAFRLIQARNGSFFPVPFKSCLFWAWRRWWWNILGQDVFQVVVLDGNITILELFWQNLLHVRRIACLGIDDLILKFLLVIGHLALSRVLHGINDVIAIRRLDRFRCKRALLKLESSFLERWIKRGIRIVKCGQLSAVALCSRVGRLFFGEFCKILVRAVLL